MSGLKEAGGRRGSPKIAESLVDKQLSCPGDGQANDELAALFENETFIRPVGELLPDITQFISHPDLSG